MATLSQTDLGLLEYAKRSGDPSVIRIAEVIQKTNQLQDAVYLPANGPFTNKALQRASYPSANVRIINDGTGRGVSSTTPIVEDTMILDQWSQVDRELADRAPEGVNAFRQREDTAFIIGMGESLVDYFIYGNNVTTPGAIKGLANRFNLTSLDNVIGTGGTGSDTTSIWVVQWGPGAVYFHFPPGSPAGLQFEDKGLVTVEGITASTRMDAYVSHFIQRVGLTVEDTRCVQRIANIETAGSSNIFDEDDLIAAVENLPGGGSGAAIYCNRTIKVQMNIALKDKTNVNFGVDNGLGVPVLQFMGIPVRKLDTIVNTESAIT